MARFSLMFAAAGVLLHVAMAAVAKASPKTTITTTTIEDNFGEIESGFHKRIFDRETDLHECALCLMHFQPKGGKSPGIANADIKEHKESCCQHLKDIGEECMCPGLRLMLETPIVKVLRQYDGELTSMTLNFPVECSLRSEPCQLQADLF